MRAEPKGLTRGRVSRPSEAGDIIKHHDGRIGLLITDVVMPEITGIELAAQLQVIRPTLRALYTSGYMPNANELPPDAAFLAKPFNGEQLLQAVASVLYGQQATTALWSAGSDRGP